LFHKRQLATLGRKNHFGSASFAPASNEGMAITVLTRKAGAVKEIVYRYWAGNGLSLDNLNYQVDRIILGDEEFQDFINDVIFK